MYCQDDLDERVAYEMRDILRKQRRLIREYEKRIHYLGLFLMRMDRSFDLFEEMIRQRQQKYLREIELNKIIFRAEHFKYSEDIQEVGDDPNDFLRICVNLNLILNILHVDSQFKVYDCQEIDNNESVWISPYPLGEYQNRLELELIVRSLLSSVQVFISGQFQGFSTIMKRDVLMFSTADLFKPISPMNIVIYERGSMTRHLNNLPHIDLIRIIIQTNGDVFLSIKFNTFQSTDSYRSQVKEDIRISYPIDK